MLCVSLTRFYHNSFSFKANTYPVLNQRHISVDIRTTPFFFTGANHARSRFSKPTLPQGAACCVLSQVTFLLSPPGKVYQVSQGLRGFQIYIINRLTMDMQTALRTLSQDLPYRLRTEQTTVLEQLARAGMCLSFCLLLNGKSECLTVFPKLMGLLRRPYESTSSITWSYLWDGLVRGKNNLFKFTKLSKRLRTFCAFGIILLCYIYTIYIFGYIWGLCCQRQVSQAGISNYIMQFTVWCNYLSLPEIPASGNKVLIYGPNVIGQELIQVQMCSLWV